jgi:hypothetical protein
MITTSALCRPDKASPRSNDPLFDAYKLPGKGDLASGFATKSIISSAFP